MSEELQCVFVRAIAIFLTIVDRDNKKPYPSLTILPAWLEQLEHFDQVVLKKNRNKLIREYDFICPVPILHKSSVSYVCLVL